ncbi:MAG TPA: hypothetical protein VM285_10625 [Polyangia bacterium]|nr:hypothetical protein [Polyangia bacterium]
MTKRKQGVAVIAVLSLAAVAGCSETDDNAPPVFSPGWTEAPAVGQGATIGVQPFEMTDPEGDAFTASLATSDPGLTAALDGAMETIELHADYAVEGVVGVDVTLEDAAGAVATYSFDVTVLPIAWLARETWGTASGPEAREHGSLVLDEEGGRVLLVTGSGYDPYMNPLADVWEYDLQEQVWTLLDPGGDAPSGGGSKRVAQIPGQQVAYLFGGYGADGAPHGEFYRLDYADGAADFTLLDQENPPGPRALHAFGYDPELGRFVMFGGFGGPIADDTWVMSLDGDAAVWEELETTDPPTPRYGFFYGFDQTRGRLIVYSGAQGTALVNPATDTWILETRETPAEWRLVAEGEEEGVPPGRRNGCSVYDSSNDRLFVFGGTPDAQTSSPGLFAFDARPGTVGWALIELEDEPPLRSSGFGFHDPAENTAAMGFGNTATAIYADWNVLGY